MRNLFFVFIFPFIITLTFSGCNSLDYEVKSISSLTNEKKVSDSDGDVEQEDDKDFENGEVKNNEDNNSSNNPDETFIAVSNSPYNNVSECDRYLSINPFPTKLSQLQDNALYVDKDHPDASDDNNGIYKKDGGTGPFKTITKLISTLVAGQTGYIRGASTPYAEEGTNIDARVGLQVLNSGTALAPITISGFPGERPVIKDTGITIISQSYITIQNIEFFNINGSAIYTGNYGKGYRVSHINIKDVYIHYVYGKDNVGGVRFDDCENCSLTNSVVKNIYDVRASATGAQPNEPYPFHAGIHGYRPKAVTIKNNLICNTKRGIYQKHPNAEGMRSHHVISNVFINTTFALSLEMAGVPSVSNDGDAPPPYVAKDIVFSYNLVLDSGGMVNSILHESALQSSGLDIYNNTAYNSTVIYYGSGLKDINSFNNILYGKQGARPYSLVNKSSSPVNPAYNYPHEYYFDGQFNYIDHNMYFKVDQIAHLGRYGDSVNENMLTSLEHWKTSFTDTGSKFLTSNPDQFAKIQDPVFLNTSNFDFKPSATLMGRGGAWSSEIGAFTADHKPGF